MSGVLQQENGYFSGIIGHVFSLSLEKKTLCLKSVKMDQS